MERKWRIIAAISFLIVVIFLSGPRPETGSLDVTIPNIPMSLKELDDSLRLAENRIPNIRPDNEARILWRDSIPSVTDYSVVYLHGFSACQEEGDPIHEYISKKYGFNLFLARLSGHGLDESENPMLHFNTKDYVKSAARAIAIGKKLGKKVILISTSTGGTLALYLAAKYPESIAAIIMYSPNIDLNNKLTGLLAYPWGVQFARILAGSYYVEWSLDSMRENFWTNKYRLEAAAQLRVLLNKTMNDKTFNAILAPVFMGYYYRDEENKDRTVSIEAMLRMYDELGTPNQLKRKVAFPDAGHHVIGSYLTSNSVEAVQRETEKFIKDIVLSEQHP